MRSASPTAMPSPSESADSAYRTLDAANRGYLSKSDVQGINGFSFEAADTNHDGKLTRDEFARAWSSQSK
jgi:Ca2+-binding EF-hand superfamily protein